MLDNHKRTLGLDIGTKRTGVALADESMTLASPLALIEASNKKDWQKKLFSLLEMYDVAQVVVGLPLNQHGEEGQDAERIREYIALLREKANFPVIEWDERFTTVQAERSLLSANVSRKDRKLVIDKIAAAIMLQSYLDHLNFKREAVSTWQEK